MRFLIPLSTLLALAVAAPQDIDFDLVDAAADPTSVPLYLGPTVTAENVEFTLSAAIADVEADVSSDPLPQKTNDPASTATLEARADSCAPLFGINASTPDSFRADPNIASQWSVASAPSGYKQTFSGLNAASNAFGYMGFSTITTYDVSQCAAKCNGKAGCLSFNIYFERDPPLKTCPGACASVVIKCTYYGGPLDATTAVNTGQIRGDFEIAVAGSNGYMSTSFQSVEGYTGPTYLGTASINAPLDCNNADTYMGSKIFTSGAFDPNLCAAACEAQSAYNLKHPPANRPPKVCHFFNTYVMSKNGVPQGQYCALYTEPWDATYATNKGQSRGKDLYTISYSFSFFNTTEPNCPLCPGDVDFAKANAQDFCTSYLSYEPSTVSKTITVTPSATAAITVTQVTVVTSTLEASPSVFSSASNSTLPAVRAVKERAVAPASTPERMLFWCASHLSYVCSAVDTGAVTSTVTATASVDVPTETVVVTSVAVTSV
ncbi:hypothetical protein K402DRAFT_455027 [Aulographum hederae CBS 113979]|uniref:Uncharacterized protein n=1 Tax=Aulographum hederae CBS 113979 TaxID=1176131 RepID=A0A6G1GX20_9PEZI|nr:hypothetical protein K402DRAFT_455027 [Aulographum hederae CBS 113979]